MSHDRGCFKCFDDTPPRRLGCGREDCPYRPETEQEIAERLASDHAKKMKRQREEYEKRMKGMG